MNVKTLRKFIDKNIKNRDLVQNTLLTYNDAEGDIDELAVNELIEDLDYFNGKISRELKLLNQKSEEQIRNEELKKIGIMEVDSEDEEEEIK